MEQHEQLEAHDHSRAWTTELCENKNSGPISDESKEHGCVPVLEEDPEAAQGTKEKISLIPLPEINDKGLFERVFSLHQPENVEVTSVDIAAHGQFVIAGCSNGQVLLFQLNHGLNEFGWFKPQLVGYIKAKGIHTNLLLTVAITEDCRFCFVGVNKGSSELLSIDVR